MIKLALTSIDSMTRTPCPSTGTIDRFRARQYNHLELSQAGSTAGDAIMGSLTGMVFESIF